MLPRVLRTVLALTVLVACAPAAAHAAAHLPPAGRVLHGVAGSTSPAGFAAQTARAPGVFQLFAEWGNVDWAFRHGRAAAPARLMLHLSTADGPGTPERITPAQIAAGDGDAFLARLNRLIADHGGPVYLRLMAEMNAYWNQYSAFDASGRARPGHSTRAFRRAWRRIAVIVRGRRGAAARLRRLGLPALRTDPAALVPAPVALQWVPQVAGAPDTRRNAPRAYWPGRRFVDWVGTDFYSRFPNWRGLDRFFRAFPRKPFVFGEYAVWGRDDPAFVRRLFAWSAARPRVRMLVYNQGVRADGPFRLRHHPRSRVTLRRILAAPRFTP
jgi:hypothetical protein